MLKKKLKPYYGKICTISIIVSVVLVAADLLTKFFEERFNWNKIIIPGWVEIRSGVHNMGCAFSFLDENPHIGQPLLITFTFLLVAALIFAFIFLPEKFDVMRIAVAVVVAGAVGNLVDRLMFRYVRDWFGLNMFGSMAYCNLADFWIVIGVGIAVVDLLFLNEWAVFPLTQSAKAAQAKRRAEEDGKKSATEQGGVSATEEIKSDSETEEISKDKNE